MAVVQAQKTAVKEVTRAQSLALMKNLTRAALSEGECCVGEVLSSS